MAVFFAAAALPADDLCPATDSCLTLPFMKVFLGRPASELITSSVLIPAGSSEVHGYLARPAANRLLPAVLLLAGDNGLAAPVLQAAREITETGFAALAIDFDPEHLAAASSLVQAVSGGLISDRVDAALDWLSEQPFVDRQRIGAVGWAEGGAWVLKLAHRGKVRAGVVSGPSACIQPDDLLQIRTVPLLMLCTSENARTLQRKLTAAGLPHTIHSYRRTLPNGDDQAWVDVYEFLGKRLEDAGPLSQANTRGGSIIKIMRAIGSNDGVRARLSQSLSSPPDNWSQAHSEAAVLLDAGSQLLALAPPKGSLAGWRDRATEFRAAAQSLLNAIERRDFPSAQDALRMLPKTCASCHADYR